MMLGEVQEGPCSEIPQGGRLNMVGMGGSRMGKAALHLGDVHGRVREEEFCQKSIYRLKGDFLDL